MRNVARLVRNGDVVIDDDRLNLSIDDEVKLVDTSSIHSLSSEKSLDEVRISSERSKSL
jgi:hypothetical protein